jgi:photosystem II stability/assembly factor-like uncharacterized protein/LysM repeat protein
VRNILISVVTIFTLFLFTTSVSFAAPAWSEAQPLGNQNSSWAASATSSNGRIMIVGNQDGGLYLSTNGGSSWVRTYPTEFEPPWYTASMSSEGQVILVGAFGRLYITANQGDTWTETRPIGDSDGSWISSSMSSDGQIILVANEDHRLYRTTNGGASWSEVRPAGNISVTWYTAMSPSGQVMLAGENGGSGGRLYISTNGGDTWSETRPAGDQNGAWRALGISTDANVMVAGNSGGRIYLSTNQGASWSETQPAGDTGEDWRWGHISGNGETIFVSNTKRLYVTTNGGDTWSETQPDGYNDKIWDLGSLSGNGLTLLAGQYDGRLYIGINPPPPSMGSSPSNSLSCGTVPTAAPDLFQINTGNNAATLYFAPVGQSTNYVVSYGFTPEANQFSVLTNQGTSTGVMSFPVNALPTSATVYFKVYAQNDCGQGVWSNTIQIGINGKSYYKNLASQVLSVLPKQTTVLGAKTQKVLGTKAKCETYTVKSGDSLWEIASEKLGSGDQYSNIVAENKLKSNTLTPGQQLKINC